MTISTTTNRVSYPGAGSVGPFAVPFRVFAPEDLLVTRRSVDALETPLVLTTDYTVAGVGDATCTVTLIVALAAGETIVIRRAPVLTQPTSIQNQGSYFPKTHEDEFDRLVMQVQRLQDQIDRSFGVSETYDPAILSMRVKPESGKALVWQSATQLGNSSLDAGAIAIPGAGRTVPTLSTYLLNNAVFNVKDYGALGDGATNDAAAFAAALAAAGGYGVVYVPPGIYRLTSTITLNRFQQLIGAGNASILLIDHVGDGVLFSGAALPVSPGSDRPSIQNLRFNTGANHPASIIANDFCQNVLLSQLFIDACTFTVGIDNRRGYLFEIDRVTFGYCTGVAIWLRQSTNDAPYWTYAPIVHGVDISHHTGDGIRFDSGQGSVRNCVVESTTGDALQLCYATTITLRRNVIGIDGCYFEEVHGYAIKSFLGAQGSLNAFVTNCYFVDGPGVPARVYVDGTFTFDSCVGNPGNTITGVSAGIVRLRSCFAMAIAGSAGPTFKIADKTFATATSLVAYDFQKAINVNGSFGGGAALILCSHSVGAGDNTNAELFLIRYGFDANAFQAISIKRADGVTDNRTYVFSVDAQGFLQVVANGTGNAKYMVIAQMSLNGENGF